MAIGSGGAMDGEEEEVVVVKRRGFGHFQSMPNFRMVDARHFGDDDGVEMRTKLYRSSRPDFLTEEEARHFTELGFRSIIDCRSAKEYRKATGSKRLDEHYPLYKVKLPLYMKINRGIPIVYKPVSDKKRDSPATGADGNQNVNVKGRHYLINFFKLNYIIAVFSRAPWYLKLYSLLFLVVDLIFNTGYRYFVRIFARNVFNKEGLVGQYTDIIQHSQNQLYAVLKLLCDPQNVPAMLNCAHGKDRTGLVTALVLICFGKSKEFIALDYARSEEELEPIKERVYDEIVNRFHMCTTFTGAKASNMMAVLDFIEKEYGSLTGYLEFIGFTPKDQARLRENLTA